MNVELLKDKAMQKIMNNMKKDGMTDIFIKNWKKHLWQDRQNQMARRKQYLTYWYNPDECMQYWEAIGERNFKALENLCRCKNGFECPACQMVRIKNV